MKTLIRKEALQVVLPVLLVIASLCAVWLGTLEFQNVLLRPLTKPLSQRRPGCVCAAGQSAPGIRCRVGVHLAYPRACAPGCN